ncbi:MAG TPA: (2Fe-2S)-binding protein [Thermoanaerobaculia bacterium]|nr:(2Fe-2S)-binding protein [Thermoanaerobaculia bacterium]
MPVFQLHVNGRMHTVNIDGNMPLLWALRDVLGLTGTKFGCGVAQCGACTVHLNGKPARSCAVNVGVAALSRITTIEGLSPDGSHPCQRAWLTGGVPQCGFCQPGQIMAAVPLIEMCRANNVEPTDEQIDAAMRGNICRCGTYPRIREAIKEAGKLS